MNGIENITRRIGEETLIEIDEIKKKTEEECESIKAKYRKTAEEEYWNILNKGKQDAESKAQRMRSAAQAEVKKQLLAVKQEMLGRAFDMALEKILSMPEDRYVEFLKSLAVKASRTGKEQIILSPSDRARYGKRVAAAANEALQAMGRPASLTLSEKTRAIRGGLILSEGKIEVNCSIEAIAELRRNELTGEVAKLLFE